MGRPGAPPACLVRRLSGSAAIRVPPAFRIRRLLRLHPPAAGLVGRSKGMKETLDRYAPFAPLVLRFAVGIIFIVHGLPKLLSPGGFAGFFGAIGIPAPGLMAIVVGIVETVGGIALLVGKGVRTAAALLAVDMLGAILLAKRSMGFLNGWEFDFLLLACCLFFLLSDRSGGSA